MTKQNMIEQIEFISNPLQWPRWPLLPLRKDDEFEFMGYKTGVISANDPTIVRLTNLFMLPPTIEEFNQIPSEIYPSIASMVKDGWYVD